MKKSVTNLVGFLLAAAIGTVAYVLLMQQRSLFPYCGNVGVLAHKELATLLRNNGAQADDRPTMAAGNSSLPANDVDELSEVLRRAVMEDNKTVIMTFTNEAWSAPGSLTDLFLESFRTGVRTEPLLKHLVMVAVDAKAFERCRQVHPLCYALPVNRSAGVNYASEQRYMAGDYLDMMWRRNRFQAHVLELGYSFVFTDVDIIWFRNPMLRIPLAADMAFACDVYPGNNPYDLDKPTNGGFMYVRASPRTVAFFRSWNASRAAYPGQHEQFIFDKMKRELSARHGVTVQYVDDTYLGSYCDYRKKRDLNKLCTVHANCVIGLQPKLKKLRQILDEWQRFKAKAGPNGTALTD